ncbi:MAG: sugar transferase [Microthrixaceae bacterium]|nr:sugar transferase [Microthrixaceae bacterium]
MSLEADVPIGGDLTADKRSLDLDRVASSPVSSGFHGGISPAQLDEFRGRSLRETALCHRSIGTEALRDLTRLPNAVHLVPPSRTDGALHVGVNHVGSGRSSAERSPSPAELRRAGESVEAYVDRRLAQAELLVLPNRSLAYKFAKRTLDLVGGLVLLALSAPLLVGLAILIRLDSPGPALFRQERVTRGGRTFRFYKFRTMYVDARERFPELYDYNFADADFADSFYKLADDPRNTRVGRWLRRTTLDELPNLFNVIRGDLSLVGPRPDLPELIQFYRPAELACLFTKAGVTGLAQVAGRSLLTVRQRLTLDVRYVAHQTVLLDLRIMWRTVIVVLLGRGAF